MTKDKRITIRISDEMHQQLFDMACEQGVTVSQLITTAIKLYLEDDEPESYNYLGGGIIL